MLARWVAEGREREGGDAQLLSVCTAQAVVVISASTHPHTPQHPVILLKGCQVSSIACRHDYLEKNGTALKSISQK